LAHESVDANATGKGICMHPVVCAKLRMMWLRSATFTSLMGFFLCLFAFAGMTALQAHQDEAEASLKQSSARPSSAGQTQRRLS